MIHEIEAARSLKIGEFYDLDKQTQIELLGWWRVHLNPTGTKR